MVMNLKIACGAFALIAMTIGCGLGEKDIGALTESGSGGGTAGGETAETSGGTSGTEGGTAATEGVSSGSETATDSSAETTDTGAEGSTAQDTASSGGDYQRACEPDDYICEGFGCGFYEGEGTVAGECYKPCQPDSTALIGEPDDECDEPERPFCGQVGDSLGGDFACNDCRHICVAVQGINVCEASFDSCTE